MLTPNAIVTVDKGIIEMDVTSQGTTIELRDYDTNWEDAQEEPWTDEHGRQCIRYFVVAKEDAPPTSEDTSALRSNDAQRLVIRGLSIRDISELTEKLGEGLPQGKSSPGRAFQRSKHRSLGDVKRPYQYCKEPYRIPTRVLSRKSPGLDARLAKMHLETCRSVRRGENALLGPKTQYAPERPHPQVRHPGDEVDSAIWTSPTGGIDIHSQMWRDRLPFRLIVLALRDWANSEENISAVAIDYCSGYRVGILASRLSRDIMRMLHRGFEQVRPKFGDHQPAVYVLGYKERDADIFNDDTSYVIRTSE